MKRVVYRVELPGNVFDEDVACLGRQLGQLIGVLDLNSDLERWYYADVETNNFSPFSSAPGLHKAGKFEDFARLIVGADQFQRGVFVASRASRPCFRISPTTDDAYPIDLGDADIEIRAFDTTYFEVYSGDLDLLERLSDLYGANLEPLENHSK